MGYIYETLHDLPDVPTLEAIKRPLATAYGVRISSLILKVPIKFYALLHTFLQRSKNNCISLHRILKNYKFMLIEIREIISRRFFFEIHTHTLISVFKLMRINKHCKGVYICLLSLLSYFVIQ